LALALAFSRASQSAQIETPVPRCGVRPGLNARSGGGDARAHCTNRRNGRLVPGHLGKGLIGVARDARATHTLTSRLTDQPAVDPCPAGRATMRHGMAHDRRDHCNPHCDGRRCRPTGGVAVLARLAAWRTPEARNAILRHGILDFRARIAPVNQRRHRLHHGLNALPPTPTAFTAGRRSRCVRFATQPQHSGEATFGFPAI
jgi:hypothetical protein